MLPEITVQDSPAAEIPKHTQLTCVNNSKSKLNENVNNSHSERFLPKKATVLNNKLLFPIDLHRKILYRGSAA